MLGIWYLLLLLLLLLLLTVQAAGDGTFLGAAIGDELRRQVAARDPGQQAALRFLSRQLQADALPVGGCVLS